MLLWFYFKFEIFSLEEDKQWNSVEQLLENCNQIKNNQETYNSLKNSYWLVLVMHSNDSELSERNQILVFDTPWQQC